MTRPSRSFLRVPTSLIASLALVFATESLPAGKVRLDRSSSVTRATSFPGLEYDQFRVVDVDAGTAAALVAAGAGEAIEDADRILLHAEVLETTQPEIKALRRPVGAFAGRRLHLVQFAGPVVSEWVAALEADGLSIVGYLPTHAFLVYADAPALARFQARALDPASRVQWEGAWQDRWKIQPDVWGRPGKASGTARQLTVELLEDEFANRATYALIKNAGGVILREPRAFAGQVQFAVELDPTALAALAAQPEVLAIRRFAPRRLHDESQAMVLAGNLTGNVATPGNYFTQLSNWGFSQAQFDASNFVVDVSDQGVDNGTTAPNHFSLYRSGNPALASRLAYRVTAGTPGPDAGTGVRGHGDINVSIIGGFVPNGSVTVGGNVTTTTAFPHADAQQFRYGLGIAPYVKVGNTTIFDPSSTNPDLNTVQTNACAAGARISNNSWGEVFVGGSYSADARTFDTLVRTKPMIVVFSAGNDGSAAGTVSPPGTAKNVITVGAAECVRGIDGASDSTHDVAAFSARGPCDDGRSKPDLLAGGTAITGMTYVTANSTLNGTAAAGYVGGFFPSGQQWWRTDSGTSHAAPAVAGAAALVYQQFINNPPYLANYRSPVGAAPPSPAMAKAYLLNSARYLTGTGAGDTLPSNAQGMGHANLGQAFDGVFRIVRDQVTADRVATGQTRTFTGNVLNASKPFRVTLVWTDPPAGTTAAFAFVNNLDLTVELGGNLYRGNVFSGASSVTGGIPDARNNVESVFLPAGSTGSFVVKVRGTNVPVSSPQDFALVIYNATPTSVPALEIGTPSVGAPGALQRGSCTTLDVPLANTGTAAATSVSAVLSTNTPGVTVAQGNSSYPDLSTSGAAQLNATPFRIRTDASVACGTLAQFTLTVTHAGAGSPAVRTFALPVGADPANYVFTASAGTVFPAGNETIVPGSAVSSGVFSVTAPFALSVYGTSIPAGGTVRVSTKGTMQLRASGGATAGANTSLPAGAFDLGATLLPFWADVDPTASGGIRVVNGGTAPNRKWCVFWSASLVTPFPVSGSNLFGIVFSEGVPGFQFTYGALNDINGPNGGRATVGVQASATGPFVQYGFNQTVLPANSTLTATFGTCGSGAGPCAGPVFTSSPPFAPAIVGSPYTHVFSASGNPAPTFALTSGTLPSGLSLSSTGVLSGTLAAAGNGSFPGLVVTASNGLAPSVTQSFDLAAVTRAENYLASFGLTGNDALPAADPNGDGLPNLLAYALGYSPIAHAGVFEIGKIRNYAGVDYYSIRFRRSSLATDLTYIVDATETLDGNWTELARSIEGGPMLPSLGVVVADAGGPPSYQVEVRDVVPVPAPPEVPKRFLRLRVVQSPP